MKKLTVAALGMAAVVALGASPAVAGVQDGRFTVRAVDSKHPHLTSSKGLNFAADGEGAPGGEEPGEGEITPPETDEDITVSCGPLSFTINDAKLAHSKKNVSDFGSDFSQMAPYGSENWVVLNGSSGPIEKKSDFSKAVDSIGQPTVTHSSSGSDCAMTDFTNGSEPGRAVGAEIVSGVRSAYTVTNVRSQKVVERFTPGSSDREVRIFDTVKPQSASEFASFNSNAIPYRIKVNSSNVPVEQEWNMQSPAAQHKHVKFTKTGRDLDVVNVSGGPSDARPGTDWRTNFPNEFYYDYVLGTNVGVSFPYLGNGGQILSHKEYDDTTGLSDWKHLSTMLEDSYGASGMNPWQWWDHPLDEIRPLTSYTPVGK